MTASARKHKIMFQRTGEPTDDGYTTQSGTWEDYCPAWASVSFGTGQERREAAQEQAAVSATFNVLANDKTRALSVTDRIVFDGDWDIQSVVPSKVYGEGVDITAVRRLV